MHVYGLFISFSRQSQGSSVVKYAVVFSRLINIPFMYKLHFIDALTTDELFYLLDIVNNAINLNM